MADITIQNMKKWVHILSCLLSLASLVWTIQLTIQLATQGHALHQQFWQSEFDRVHLRAQTLVAEHFNDTCIQCRVLDDCADRDAIASHVMYPNEHGMQRMTAPLYVACESCPLAKKRVVAYFDVNATDDTVLHLALADMVSAHLFRIVPPAHLLQHSWWCAIAFVVGNGLTCLSIAYHLVKACSPAPAPASTSSAPITPPQREPVMDLLSDLGTYNQYASQDMYEPMPSNVYRRRPYV